MDSEDERDFEPASLMSRPKFVENMRSLYVQTDCTATFIAVLSDVKLCKIHWLKDGKPLLGKRFVARVKSSSATLNITNVQPSDEGTYQCVAKNPAGRSTTSAGLRVASEAYAQYAQQQEEPCQAGPSKTKQDMKRKPKKEERCPSCKAPCRYIEGEVKEHLTNCRGKKLDSLPPCPSKNSCRSIFEKHYVRYSHKNSFWSP